MTDRLTSAIAELVAALRAEVASTVPPPSEDRLLSIEEAASAMSLGRTSVYALIGSGRLRTIKVGRRRLVPVSAIRTVAGD
jgi:excisionase family DNA binding protein